MDTMAPLNRKVMFQLEQSSIESCLPAMELFPGHTEPAGVDTVHPGANTENQGGIVNASCKTMGSERDRQYSTGNFIADANAIRGSHSSHTSAKDGKDEKNELATTHPHSTTTALEKKKPFVVQIKLPGRQRSGFTPVELPGATWDIIEVRALKRVLGAAWIRPHWPSSISIRDRVAVSLQHHAFLSIRNLSELYIADCVMEHLDISASQKVRCLGLCLRQYAQLPGVDTPVAIVARHNDYRRCSVSAVAFYLFERFHLQLEDMPSFELSGTWSLVKLLKGPLAIPDATQKSLSQRFVKIFDDAGYKILGNIDEIQTGKKELQHLGVSTESPARIGPKNFDIAGTMAMAGFPSSPYSLRREALLPPLELQRLIFPSIESSPGLLDPNQWKAHCDRVMLDSSPFSDKETVQGAGRQRRVAAAKESIDEYAGVARLDHLHLLLWMRRIVLQDAVLFFEDGATNRLLDHAIFQRAEFKKFRSDLLRTMGTDNSNQYQYQELHRELSDSTSLSESEFGQNRFSSMIEAPQQEEIAGQWVSHGNWHELRKRPKAKKARSKGGNQESLSEQLHLQEQVKALQQQVEEQALTMRQMEQQEKERQQREKAYLDQQKCLLNQLSEQTLLTQKLWQRLELQQKMSVPRSPMSPPADGVATEDRSQDLIVLGRISQIQTPPPGRVAPTTIVGAIPETVHPQDPLTKHTAPKSIHGPMSGQTLPKLNSPGRAVCSSLPDPQSKQTQLMQGVPSGRVAIIPGSSLASEQAQPMQTPLGPVSASNPGQTLAPKFRRRSCSGGVIKRKSHIMWSRRPKAATQVAIGSQELYCLCREPDDGSFMIACDKCDEWYHGGCIGVLESDRLEKSKYFCQSCQLTQQILEEPSLLDEMKETELSRFPSEEKDIKEEDIQERVFSMEITSSQYLFTSFNPPRLSNPTRPSSNSVNPLAFSPSTPAAYPADRKSVV